MPYLRTRLQVVARIRRDGQFAQSLPSASDLNEQLNEALAWWWDVLSSAEGRGIGNADLSTITTPGQGFAPVPAQIRHVREVYRQDQTHASESVLREAYGNPTQEPQLPGVYWVEYSVMSSGQVLQLRPTPTTVEVIRVVGTSAPPSWPDDITQVDLISEVHERAIVDLVRARAEHRDAPADRQAAEQAAAQSVRLAIGYSVPKVSRHWSSYLRP